MQHLQRHAAASTTHSPHWRWPTRHTIEPSARVFALVEHESAYVDSLDTPQAERSFSSGRASGGAKIGTKWLVSDSLDPSHYVGLYGDYNFTSDDATVTAATTAANTPETLVTGWSARLTGGITATAKSGTSVSLNSELGGLGSMQFLIWSGRARGRIPF